VVRNNSIGTVVGVECFECGMIGVC
jgi:hypothetical protein